MYDLENVHAFSLKRRAVHQLETTHNFFKRKEAGAKGTT
jgi:hypothetical protein